MRQGRDTARAMADEGTRVLAALRSRRTWWRFDGRGTCTVRNNWPCAWEHWRGQGRDLAFLIGGPEGHAPEVPQRADERWSLGLLTLPHMLVRLVLAEHGLSIRAAALFAAKPSLPSRLTQRPRSARALMSRPQRGSANSIGTSAQRLHSARSPCIMAGSASA